MGENILLTLRGLLSLARIHGDKERALNLQTMIGDLQRIDKDIVNRDEFVSYLKAQIKAIETSKQRALDVGVKVPVDADYERLLYSMLQEYQPAQLSETDIRKYFAELVKLNPGITKGTLMKAIKEEFSGRYEGRMAAQIAGEFNQVDSLVNLIKVAKQDISEGKSYTQEEALAKLKSDRLN